jgi:hypothetical protein
MAVADEEQYTPSSTPELCGVGKRRIRQDDDSMDEDATRTYKKPKTLSRIFNGVFEAQRDRDGGKKDAPAKEHQAENTEYVHGKYGGERVSSSDDEEKSGAGDRKSISDEAMYDDELPQVMHGKYGGERVSSSDDEEKSGAADRKSISKEGMYDDELPQVMHGKYGGERVSSSDDEEKSGAVDSKSFSKEIYDDTHPEVVHGQHRKYGGERRGSNNSSTGTAGRVGLPPSMKNRMQRARGVVSAGEELYISTSTPGICGVGKKRYHQDDDSADEEATKPYKKPRTSRACSGHAASLDDHRKRMQEHACKRAQRGRSGDDQKGFDDSGLGPDLGGTDEEEDYFAGILNSEVKNEFNF